MVTAGRTARFVLPDWVPLLAIACSLALAWANFLTTGRWAPLAGALHGPKKPWYAAALIAATALTFLARRSIGGPVRLGPWLAAAVLAGGAGVLVTALLSRLPLTTWGQVPFRDDWTPLFQHAVNGVELLKRGSVVGWNWWFLGGYPTSTDIAQNFSTLAFVPMVLFGETVGYHVLHAALFLAVPCFVWWDLRHESRELAAVGGGLAAVSAAGYLWTIGSSGDTNSLAGVACAGAALMGSRAARLGRRWGGSLLIVSLTLASYSHTAFFVYALVYLALEAAYFRDAAAAKRAVAAAAIAGMASLPAHWESLRYPDYVSFNNTVYSPGAPVPWSAIARTLYYNVEILALPQRWFNDYRSLANVWLPALFAMALLPGRSRTGYYACAAVLTQMLLRLNSPSLGGALFDRVQHMLPLLVAPALAGFVLRTAGSVRLAVALLATIGLYVATALTPIRHVPDLRAFDPAFIDRVAAADGNLVLVEVSPHRDMDSDPRRRTPTTPFESHFEALLPRLANQRFYSQMIDGWVWNVFRGQVVGAGTFEGRAIGLTPADRFVDEMSRWGVRHLFVWTDATRRYLGNDPRFVERWRGGRWSQFERTGADIRSVVVSSGAGRLEHLDPLGADVALAEVRAGDRVVVRANYYPAWQASVDGRPLALENHRGQLAFMAPRSGTYVVRLDYPRYRWLVVSSIAVLMAGMFWLARWPRPSTVRSADPVLAI